MVCNPLRFLISLLAARGSAAPERQTARKEMRILTAFVARIVRSQSAAAVFGGSNYSIIVSFYVIFGAVLQERWLDRAQHQNRRYWHATGDFRSTIQAAVRKKHLENGHPTRYSGRMFTRRACAVARRSGWMLRLECHHPCWRLGDAVVDTRIPVAP